VLWIQGLSTILLVLGRGEIAGLSAVNAVMLNYSAVDKGIIGSVVSSG